jgi:hypothetical protein
MQGGDQHSDAKQIIDKLNCFGHVYAAPRPRITGFFSGATSSWSGPGLGRGATIYRSRPGPLARPARSLAGPACSGNGTAFHIVPLDRGVRQSTSGPWASTGRKLIIRGLKR